MTEKKLRALRKEFANHTKSNLHSEYDKGYFQALENFVKKLENFDLTKEEKGDAQKQKD